MLQFRCSRGSQCISHRPLSPRVSHEQNHYVPSAHRSMLAGFAALGRSRLNSRKHHWTAPVELTAVQPGPWLYQGSTAPPGESQKQNRARRALPRQPTKKPHESNSPKPQKDRKEVKRRGGDGDRNLPHRKRIQSTKDTTNVVKVK